MTLALVIALSGSNSSGAAQATVLPTTTKVAPEKCPAVDRAIRFYSGRIAYWHAKLGAPKPAIHSRSKCPRYLAHVLQRKAYGLRKAYARFYAYHWDWRSWLPDKWQRIGACETGYGQRPGRWDWNSGTYQGAFGFYSGTWDQYKPAGAPSEAYLATPRQQYQAALNVYAAHGYGAWGCGGA